MPSCRLINNILFSNLVCKALIAFSYFEKLEPRSELPIVSL